MWSLRKNRMNQRLQIIDVTPNWAFLTCIDDVQPAASLPAALPRSRSGSMTFHCRIFDNRSHPVVTIAVDFDAVDLTLKAGEALAKSLHCEDKLDDR